jgi:hypothetical protein
MEVLTGWIGEYWADDEKPIVDGDVIRNLLVLGPVSVNAADAFNGKTGRLAVKRKFHHVIGEQSALFDGVEGHLGPHRFVGEYPEADKLGKFVNPRKTDKGLRMDLIGESSFVQFQALKDHINNNRPFGGFSPLMDGSVNPESGETTISAVKSIDWVPNAASVKSIAESEATALDTGIGELGAKHEALKTAHEELKGKHEALSAEHEETKKQIGECRTMIGECHRRIGESMTEHETKFHAEPTEEQKKKDEEDERARIAESIAAIKAEEAKKIAESVASNGNGGARNQPIPVVRTAGLGKVTDLRKFVREGV